MKENYTNYSKQHSTPVKEAPVMEPVPEEELEPINETTVEQAQLEAGFELEEEVAPPPEPKTGIVTANKLNIRKLPGLNSEVVTVVERGTELTIDPSFETVEWYEVYMKNGWKGYCMKKFITVK